MAECVRREAKADIAIVHSGSFRCDSLLSPKVTLKALLDTFIFDKPKAGQDEPIMILRLPNDDIEILLAHGKSSASSGAFPQFSDHRNRNQSDHIVAISSFLLINSRSNDGYVKDYAERTRMSDDHARNHFRALHSRQFQIIPAIVEHAKHVGYIAPQVSQTQETGAAQFITLARVVREQFERVYPYSPRTIPVKRNNGLRGVLSGQKPVSDTALATAREALRDFLLLDDVRLGEVGALYAAITVHEANFQDDVRYNAYFRAAAYNIPGITYYNDFSDRYYAFDDDDDYDDK